MFETIEEKLRKYLAKSPLLELIPKMNKGQAFITIGGLLVSYSAVTFAGFYFSFHWQIRQFVDSRVLLDFFFALGISFAVSIVFTRITLLLFQNLFKTLKRVLFRFRQKKTIRSIWRFSCRYLIWEKHIPEVVLLCVLAFFVGVMFLSLSYTILWFAYSGIAVSMMMLILGIDRDTLSARRRTQAEKNNRFSKFLTAFTITLSISAFSLGLVRMQYVLTNFAILEFEGSERVCVSVLAATADGVIYSDEIGKSPVIMPNIVLNSHFAPFEWIAKLSTGSVDECLQLKVIGN